MIAHRYIACDLGAESGRIVLGTLADGRLTLAEVHRFPTPTLRQRSGLHWEVSAIFREIVAGIALAARSADGQAIDGISVDSWGVDYVLLDPDGSPVAEPFHYRDSRTQTSYPELRERLGEPWLYKQTGIQFQPFNTVFPVLASAAIIRSASARLAANRFSTSTLHP